MGQEQMKTLSLRGVAMSVTLSVAVTIVSVVVPRLLAYVGLIATWFFTGLIVQQYLDSRMFDRLTGKVSK